MTGAQQHTNEGQKECGEGCAYFSWVVRAGLSREVALKPRPYEGEEETGRWNIPGRTGSALALTTEGAWCVPRIERPVSLVYIHGHQDPFSLSSVVMHADTLYHVSQPPSQLSMATGQSSHQWDANKWSVSGAGPLRGGHTPSSLSVLSSSWLHLGLGSHPAWTRTPHGIVEPQLKGPGSLNDCREQGHLLTCINHLRQVLEREKTLYIL